MSGVTLTQLRAWDPSMLNPLASAWDELGTRLEGYFDTYVNDVEKLADGSYWEGITAETAQNGARADRKAIQDLADKLAALTKRMRTGYHEINAPLQRALGYVSAAIEHGFNVTDQLQILDPQNDRKNTKTINGLQRDLDSAVTDAVNADRAVAGDLDAARDGLRATFAAPTTLGTEQGRTDGAQLANDISKLTPEQYQRLVAAGQLTPAQAAALQAGRPVDIPASQMEYLNSLARSLDDKSPQQIRHLMDSLPHDARQALANSLQLISHRNVTSSTAGGADLSAQGNADLLPRRIQQSLTRPDLVTTGTRAVSYDPLEDPLSVGIANKEIQLNGVADNQAIAAIAGDADPRYRSGSELDSEVLNVGARYLHGQPTFEQASHGNIGGSVMTVDGSDHWDQDPSKPMFAAVGDDKPAVLGLVSGHGGTGDNQQFLHDAFTHQWDDGGKAVSNLFRFGDHDAVVDNPDDPVQVAVASRQGQIMNAVGQFAGADDNWHDLSDIGGQTAGQINPDLVREVSKSFAPYINTMTGGTATPGTLGFDADSAHAAWYNPEGHHGAFTGARNVFALMDTDDQASKAFNATAYNDMLANETNFAHSPTGSAEATHHLDNIGRLAGLVDAGSRQSISAHDTDQHDIAVQAYKQESSAFDADRELLEGSIPLGDDENFELPYGEQASMALSAGGDGLKESIIGEDPRDHQPTDPGYEGLDLDRIQYDIVSQAPGVNQYALTHHLLGGNGQFVPWEEIREDGNLQSSVETYFDNTMAGNSDVQVDRQYQAVTNPERQSETHD